MWCWALPWKFLFHKEEIKRTFSLFLLLMEYLCDVGKCSFRFFFVFVLTPSMWHACKLERADLFLSFIFSRSLWNTSCSICLWDYALLYYLKFLWQKKGLFSFSGASNIAQLKLYIFSLSLALFMIWYRNTVEVRSREQLWWNSCSLKGQNFNSFLSEF